MKYNSEKEELVMPEYGRAVQKLIKEALNIEDKAERQAYMNEVIELMQIMNPQSKNVIDSKDKLWKHAFKISDYKLDVDTPNGITPQPNELSIKPNKLTYPKEPPRFRHYGKLIHVMVKKAIAMEEGDIKQEFTRVIASYMKMAYQTWNVKHYVNDEVIIKDLNDISQGKLQLEDETVDIDYLSNSNKKKGKKITNINKSYTKKSKSKNRRRRR